VKDGDALFVRYHTDAFIDGTERVYAQDYVSQLIAENGKIKVLREYLNVIKTARALLPNGLADVPPAAD
jgi:ketosteroid isomerase-like protein